MKRLSKKSQNMNKTIILSYFWVVHNKNVFINKEWNSKSLQTLSQWEDELRLGLYKWIDYFVPKNMKSMFYLIIGLNWLFAIIGKPRPTIRWYKDNQPLDDSWIVTPQGIIRNELVITRLLRTDHKSILTCQASNSNLTKPVTASITLELNCKSKTYGQSLYSTAIPNTIFMVFFTLLYFSDDWSPLHIKLFFSKTFFVCFLPLNCNIVKQMENTWVMTELSADSSHTLPHTPVPLIPLCACSPVSSKFSKEWIILLSFITPYIQW